VAGPRMADKGGKLPLQPCERTDKSPKAESVKQATQNERRFMVPSPFPIGFKSVPQTRPE